MAPPRAPRARGCSSGGIGWLNAWKISSVGRNRIAVFGTRMTSVFFAISICTLAVIPGLSLRSLLGTSITVP